jgi:hypothetical protein
MRLHLEDGREPVADIDDARVLARPLDDARAFGGEAGEVDAGTFIRAVLAPHDAEDAELGVRGGPAEVLYDSLVFGLGELV